MQQTMLVKTKHCVYCLMTAGLDLRALSVYYFKFGKKNSFFRN